MLDARVAAVVGRQATLRGTAVGGRPNATAHGGGSPKTGLPADDNGPQGAHDEQYVRGELHHHLRILESERRHAEHTGLINSGQYRRDLEEEMAECRAAYVGAAVTEIATLRAELSGRQVG
jgi:hypothetical protein